MPRCECGVALLENKSLSSNCWNGALLLLCWLPTECRRKAYSSRVGWPFRIGPSRKMHPGMSAQTGTHFPDRPSSGSCVPDSGSRVGCRFRLRSLAEAVSRNRASEWDVLSRQELKWKLRPGFKPRNGTCFPDGLQAETVSQNRHGFKWKTRLRIPRRRFWRLWWARGASPTHATTAWR